jgi:hypothetical protein
MIVLAGSRPIAWTRTSAVANTGYLGSAASKPNNDEYQGTLVAPVAGEYDYGYRFSGDAGATGLYCDSGAPGVADGYRTANAGRLSVTD